MPISGGAQGVCPVFQPLTALYGSTAEVYKYVHEYAFGENPLFKTEAKRQKIKGLPAKYLADSPFGYCIIFLLN